MTRVGVGQGNFSVADHANGEQDSEKHREPYHKGHTRGKEKRNACKKRSQREKEMKQAAPVERGVFEAQNE